MKKIALILLASISLMACKKEVVITDEKTDTTVVVDSASLDTTISKPVLTVETADTVK